MLDFCLNACHHCVLTHLAISTDSPLIQYDEHGVVTEWGPTNAKTLVDVYVQGQSNHVLPVDAWKVLNVTVLIRNTHCDTRFALKKDWQVAFSFVVERWDQIFPHFERFHRRVGIASRFKWEVERFLWTSQNGWEPADYMSKESPLIQYDGDGVITEWGPANTRTLVDHDVQGRVLEVDAWMVLNVTVCTHNNDCDTLAEEEHWQKRSSFVVERWDQIFAHFKWFYGSAGIANRFKWEVERWLWTDVNGWEPYDYL